MIPTPQLQPAEYDVATPAANRLPVLRKWKKWLRSLERIKTPNPWTVH